ncbi:hypothetical protein K502DRAFT_256468 [Neoconidiobolus thromboides FSU 785]|nr:hypothetical protein K502DRAFT_256468 [Neoconidiobolus thromboides FSU 785]
MIGLSLITPDQSDTNYQDKFDKFCTIVKLSRNLMNTLFELKLEHIFFIGLKEFFRGCDLSHKCLFIYRVTIDTSNNYLAEILATETIPILFEKFQSDPNITITEDLKTILLKLKNLYPYAFYTPLIKMIPTQDSIISSNLCILIEVLSRCITSTELIFVDIDLFSVILFTDLGGEKNYSIGQILFLSKFINVMEELYQNKNNLNEDEFNKYKNYFLAIENQISIFLTAKQKLKDLKYHPIIQHLICCCLLQIQKFVPCNKRPGWLSPYLNWIMKDYIESYLVFDFNMIIVELKEIEIEYFNYFNEFTINNQKRKSYFPSIVSNSIIDNDNNNNNLIQSIIDSNNNNNNNTKFIINYQQLFSIDKKLSVFTLLLTVYVFITKVEYRSVYDIIWELGIILGDFNLDAMLLFLFAAEKDESNALEFIKVKLNILAMNNSNSDNNNNRI